MVNTSLSWPQLQAYLLSAITISYNTSFCQGNPAFIENPGNNSKFFDFPAGYAAFSNCENRFYRVVAGEFAVFA